MTETKDLEIAISELKHSIKIHLLIMAGPSQQLCAFLVKTIDLLEDDDIQRKKQETLLLAFSIVEAIAVHVQQAIDARGQVAKNKGNHMPENVRSYSDNILITLGQVRGLNDKRVAKTAVLVAIGKALDALGTFTGAVYPTIFEVDGRQLNNHQTRPGEQAETL